MKTDRRVQRTRQALRDALITLILEKGYEAITVQDILERANVRRSTFYGHYFGGKEELLLGVFEQIQESLALTKHETNGNIGLRLFHHAQTHHQLYKAMAGKQSGHLVRNYVEKYLADLMREHLQHQVLPQTLPLEIAVQSIVGSFLALMTWWLEHDLPYSAAEMDSMFTQLTQHGLNGVGNKGI